MRLLLDTNRYSDLARHVPEVEALVAAANEVFLSFITLAELHVGFRHGTRRKQNERELETFLSEYAVSVIYADAKTVDLFADLSLQLRRQGTPIPDHDIWIAALALEHSLTLYARDKHFDHLPQVARV